MISTKTKKMTPEERKEKVKELQKEHDGYFNTINMSDSVYIPKMAYRPTGKDELYVSFFPSELDKGNNIYTEFVSIDYESEDPKRTLYLWEHNKHWEEEYELVESSSGFQRHIIPVGELKVINDVNSRNANILDEIENIHKEKLSTRNQHSIESQIVFELKRIANSLEKLTYKKLF